MRPLICLHGTRARTKPWLNSLSPTDHVPHEPKSPHNIPILQRLTDKRRTVQQHLLVASAPANMRKLNTTQPRIGGGTTATFLPPT